MTWSDILAAAAAAGVQPSDRLEFAFLDAEATPDDLKVLRHEDGEGGWFSIDIYRRGGEAAGGFIIAGARESQQDAYDRMAARLAEKGGDPQ